MTKTILHLMLSGIFLVLTGLLVLAAVFLKEPFFAAYTQVSRWITGTLGNLTGAVPAALWEFLGALLLALLIFTLIRAILKRRVVRWLTGLLLFVTIGIFVFVGIWGLGYYAPPMGEKVGLPDREISEAELQQAAEYYRDRANALAPRMERDENGTLIPRRFEELAPRAGEGYEALAGKYSCFDSRPAPPKKLLLTDTLLGKMGVSGIFVCFTGEACVSTAVYAPSVPFAMCHELAHRMAFAREDEANFAGFLACTENPMEEFQYSGWYTAFCYCWNALYEQDPAAAEQVGAGMCPELAADCRGAGPHYEKTENETAARLAEQAYDVYLKGFSAGEHSYDQVTKLLVLWHLSVS